MKIVITISILFVSIFSTNLSARDWYEKSCTPTQKDKVRNYYVGGQYNKNHLHVGSDFIHITSDNNRSKPVTSGKANCSLLDQAISDVGGGGFAIPADVTTCLNAAKDFYC